MPNRQLPPAFPTIASYAHGGIWRVKRRAFFDMVCLSLKPLCHISWLVDITRHDLIRGATTRISNYIEARR